MLDNGKYRLEFLYEELDDLAGYVASCSNQEDSEAKQARWDALCDKLEALVSLSENIHQKRPSSVKQPGGLKQYIFDVWLEDRKHRKVVMRRIQIAHTKSLYNFAKVITRAFGFYFDHCFGFYDNFERYHDSKKAFELFFDIGEEPLSPATKSVKKTQLGSAFKHPGEKLLFLFDYGDGWRFTVELKEIKIADKPDLKPVVLESIGEAPLQYPPSEDD
jgi:hypothetical protein